MSALTDKAFSLETLLKCKGYNPRFIDEKINVSHEKVLPTSSKNFLPVVNGNSKGILNYTDLSVLYHSERKVPFFAAYNINGSSKTNKTSRPKFRQDPRIETLLQLDKPFYDLEQNFTEFEIGHMASNAEMGRGKNGPIKAFQTFHFTNSVPQAEKLNTGIWQGLEKYIIKEAATVTKNKKICVFTGPLISDEDPGYIKMPSFKIPLLFFKVIVFQSPKGVFSTAFMMSHEEKLKEDNMFVAEPQIGRLAPLSATTFFDDFKFRKVFQVNIDLLESVTGLKFSWKGCLN
ncbi:MAG: DNA/RNA non-specific endonuclease [Bacteroidota bacterium]